MVGAQLGDADGDFVVGDELGEYVGYSVVGT